MVSLRRAALVGVVALWSVVSLADTALAASVSIVDAGYRPASVRIGEGESVIWTNTGSRTHTSTQDGPLSFWDTGRIAPGAFGEVDQGVLLAAGTYPYHCTIHPGMQGVVRVSLMVSPTSGTTKATFTLTLSGGVESGYVYDVQERIGSQSWRTYRSGVATTTTTFTTSTAGTYAFRSRLHRISDGATSGWSPKRTIVVTT
jgi:plastocyanin